jgi:SPP1 gp7 family putative phage head morphogenesis protein
VVGLKEDLQKEIVEILPTIEALFRSDMGATRRVDSVGRPIRLDVMDAFDLLEAALQRILVRFSKALGDRRPQIFDVGQAINKDNEQATRKSLGVDLLLGDDQIIKAIDAWTKDNARKITRLAEAETDQISNIVLNGYRQGLSPSGLRSAILDTFRAADERESQMVRGMSLEARAKFVARDQVATLNGQVARMRQERVGIRKYIWQTSEDERVRPSHAALNGEIMSWDDPPPFGHPGMDYNCRCVAIPYLDDTDDDDE